jgi:MFS family permease
LDTTIVSTALPTISKEFYAYESYTWVITAYMITDTAIQPLVGKLADIFSGRSLMILFFFIFTISSLLCGVASNIGVLIIGRVIQGIGGGGIISLAIILIADITPLSKRYYLFIIDIYIYRGWSSF